MDVREIRTYRKVRETEADRKYGVMVPLGTPIRVSQDAGEGDMEMEGWERVPENLDEEVARAHEKRQNGDKMIEREWVLVAYDSQGSCTCRAHSGLPPDGHSPNGSAA